MNFKRPIFLIIFTLTLLSLAVSLVVHALLYAGFNTRDHFPFVWSCLQYAVLIGFIPTVVRYLSKRSEIIKRQPPYIWGSAKYEEHSSREIYGETIVAVAIAILFFYALVNPFYWYVEHLHQWNPYVIDGQYFAYYKIKGNKIRSLTAEEYKLMSLYFARAGSSHWLVCHSIALVLLYSYSEAAPNKALQLTAR